MKKLIKKSICCDCRIDPRHELLRFLDDRRLDFSFINYFNEMLNLLRSNAIQLVAGRTIIIGRWFEEKLCAFTIFVYEICRGFRNRFVHSSFLAFVLNFILFLAKAFYNITKLSYGLLKLLALDTRQFMLRPEYRGYIINLYLNILKRWVMVILCEITTFFNCIFMDRVVYPVLGLLYMIVKWCVNFIMLLVMAFYNIYRLSYYVVKICGLDTRQFIRRGYRSFKMMMRDLTNRNFRKRKDHRMATLDEEQTSGVTAMSTNWLNPGALELMGPLSSAQNKSNVENALDGSKPGALGLRVTPLEQTL